MLSLIGVLIYHTKVNSKCSPVPEPVVITLRDTIRTTITEYIPSEPKYIYKTVQTPADTVVLAGDTVFIKEQQVIDTAAILLDWITKRDYDLAFCNDSVKLHLSIQYNKLDDIQLTLLPTSKEKKRRFEVGLLIDTERNFGGFVGYKIKRINLGAGYHNNPFIFASYEF